jgi:hypothetical protein
MTPDEREVVRLVLEAVGRVIRRVQHTAGGDADLAEASALIARAHHLLGRSGKE